MADGFEVGAAYIKISPDTSDFGEELKGKVEEATAGAEAKVKVGGDDAELRAVLDRAKAALDELAGRHARVKLGADTGDLDAKTDEAKAKVDDLTSRPRSVKLSAEDAAAKAKIDALKAELDRLRLEKQGIKLTADASDAEIKIAQLQAQIAALREEEATVGAGGEGGSLVGAIGAGVAALSPGLAGAAAGLGLVGATGALAFGGIAQALSAAHQSSQTVGLTSQQLASQHFSNSVQVQQAEQSVTQAREQAAQDAVTSAASIEQADMNVAEVQRNTAAAQIQALQSVTQAQNGVQQSTYNLSEANYQLGQAYVQAREQITQLNDQLADSKLNVRSAQLAIQQALYNQRLVDQNAYSTSIQRQQAALAVAQAQQQLKDAQDRQTAATYAANLANKQGVESSQQVIQAKQGVRTAQDSVTAATNAYADAQRNLRNTELNNAAQVKQAQMQLAQAREQAAFQQKMAAQSVAIAERNVTNTIREQRLSMAAMISTSNSAANQFARYMGRLTPVGRRFVHQVLSMRGAFRQLEAAAQKAVLPGFTSFLTSVARLVPTVRGGITQMGGAISRVFSGFGRALAAPGAQKVLRGLIANGIEFANVVLPAFGQFLGQLGLLGSRKGAVTGLASGLAGIGEGLAGFVSGLTPYIPQLNQVLGVFGKIAAALGPAFAQDIGLLLQPLSFLARLMNSKWGGPFISGLAHAASMLLLVKGVAKLLPGQLGEYFGAIPGKLGKFLLSPLKKLGGQFVSLVKPGWSKVFGSDGMIASGLSALGGKLRAAGSSVAGWVSQAASNAAQFASAFGQKMAAAGQAVAQFGAGVGTRLAEAATATWTWIGENAAAAAAYIATNVAEAASATAAFIAENAATLGLAGLIGGLVAAVIYLGTHWRQVWTDVKIWAEDAWNFIYDGFGKYLLPLLGPAGLIALGVIELAQHWSAVWGAIRSAAADVWHWIDTGARGFVSTLGAVWGRLESVFKTPVNFLINTVYDNGIRRFWNDVVGAVGLGSLKLHRVAGLSRGGVLPGYAPGRDTVPAMLSPGEAVLTPGATRAIGGPPVVNALNAAYAPAGAGSRPGHYARGGIISGIGSWFSGLINSGRIAAALMSGNTAAFTNAASKFIGRPAAGNIGRVMTAIPRTLIHDLARAVMNTLGIGASSGSTGYTGAGSVTKTVASWFAQAVRAAGVPQAWIPGLETIARYESSFNPRAVNNTAAGIAAGGPEGIMQTIPATFQAYHAPGTSDNIFDPVADIAAAARYIRYTYGTPANTPGLIAVSQGKPYTAYDSGGWLPPSGPGMPLPVNLTGRPEAVLTPQQSDALMTLADRLRQGGTAPREAPVVNVYFTGTQLPTHEQMAEIERSLSLAVGA